MNTWPKFQSLSYSIIIYFVLSYSKGLDFPKVTCVGVVSADASLNIPDFRSNERTYALLNQVAGRAGRSGLESEVIIQTYNPDHFTIKMVEMGSFLKNYQYEMAVRKNRLSHRSYSQDKYWVFWWSTHNNDIEGHSNFCDKWEKYDILLGTQMISKGLDFPKVTCVGVVSADAS